VVPAGNSSILGASDFSVERTVLMRLRSVAALIKYLAPAVAFLSILVGPAQPASSTEVVRATLKNGLRIVIVRNPLASVVTTEINYLAGSNEAPNGFPGMAHAQEHMMFRGSPGLSADQLSNIEAAMGGDFDADTQQTVTQYYFSVPAADLDVALHIESIRMKGILDEQSLWDQERGAIDQEVASDLSNPQYKFYIKLLDTMFAGTPYAHDALGTRESFAKTTGDMLKGFHQSWYAPNNAILVIVGDIDPAKALDQAREYFEPIPPRAIPAKPSVRLQPMKPASIKLDTDLPYGLAVVAYRLPGYGSPDYAAGEVLADVLGNQRADLYGLVPQGKALYAGFSTEELPVATIGYAMAAVPQGTDASTLIPTLKDIVASYVRKGVPADLVEASKRHEVADAEFQKNSVSGLAEAWSQAVAVEGRNSPDDDINAIREVTTADVDRVAKRFLDNQTAVVAVLTPHPSGRPVSSKGFHGKESFAPKQTKAVSLPEWARKVERTPQVPPSALHPTVSTLPNGLRLIVQPEMISPTVSVFGAVKNTPDLQTPRGQEGVSRVLNDLFSYGTTTMDRLAFQKALDDIAANESAGTSFSLQVLTEHFDRGVELLATNLLHPALPAEAFTIVQKEAAAAAVGELQSPGYLSQRALRKALYPKNDPTLRQATPASISSLRLQDVKAYYGSAFRPDLTTIVVIGQVSPETARSVFEKYFGAWKVVGPKPETDLSAVPPNKPSSVVVPDTSRVQDEVTLAETLGLTRNNPDYYALQAGNHVLSGAFYATRLYHDLREEAGLVYTVESGLDVGKTRSLFEVYYACDPQNVVKARGLALRDLRQMQSEPVTPKELQQAKTLLVTRIPLGESSEDSIAGQLLELSMMGLPLDEPTQAARHYVDLTAEQIQAAFKKWIRPEDFVQVVRGPRPE
jgi:zinc protease